MLHYIKSKFIKIYVLARRFLCLVMYPVVIILPHKVISDIKAHLRYDYMFIILCMCWINVTQETFHTSFKWIDQCICSDLEINLFWHYSCIDCTQRFLSLWLTLSHSSSKELSRSWPQVLLNVTFRPWMFSTLGRMMSVSWAHSILNNLFTPLSASLFLSDFLGKNHKHNC